MPAEQQPGIIMGALVFAVADGAFVPLPVS
jgi:hypothetical protein